MSELRAPQGPEPHAASEREWSLWQIFAVVIGLVLVIWSAVFALFQRNTTNYDQSFNGANSLFSALAFAGVIAAIVLQRRELILQRKELEETRAVLQRQHDQLEAQTHAFRKQNFETTFFSLINLHHGIVTSMQLTYLNESPTGRECSRIFNSILRQKHTSHRTTRSSEKNIRLQNLYEQEIADVYLEFYNEWQSIIGHYFRNLDSIVRFIKESENIDRQFYIRMVRAQLSSFELALLFYNCLSSPGKGFKPLVEEFALLKTVEDIHLLDPSHRKFYKQAAFG